MTVNERVHMLTLSCSNKECFIKLRIGRFLERQSNQIGALQFCPVCGSSAMTRNDIDETYWEVMSEHFNLPIEALRLIYSTWDTVKYQRFGDYIRSIEAEIEADNVR